MEGHDNSGGDSAANNLDRSNAGGAGGGIFSTPDLTVNTENLPQNQPSAQPTSGAARSFNFGRRNRPGNNTVNSERVASAFAQTEATQQSQMLNDAVLASANATTQSTATGDIQLDTGGKKKRKKWPVVVGIVAALAIVGVGALFLLSEKGFGGLWTWTMGQGTLKDNYFKFANYLLYQEESIDVLSNNCRNNLGCPFDRVLITYTADDSINYLLHAQELWGKVQKSMTNDLSTYAEGITEDLDYLIAYATGGYITGEIADLVVLRDEALSIAESASEDELRIQYYNSAAQLDWQIKTLIIAKKDSLMQLCYGLAEMINE